MLPVGATAFNGNCVDKVYSIIAATSSRAGLRRYNLLYSDALLISRTENKADLYSVLESDMCVSLAERSRNRFIVHAGVVTWKDRAIVMPGSSFTGKTELVKAFLEAGACYFSDEFAVFDRGGRVNPFARDLHLRPRGTSEGEHHVRSRIQAGDLGAKTGVKPIEVGLVLFSRYHPDARWAPMRISAGESVIGLAGNSLSFRRQPARTIDALQAVAKNANSFRSKRSEAKQVVESILRNFDQFVRPMRSSV